LPKITGGSLNSRKLKSPKGPNVRPTPGRVKESLFSILMDRIDGSAVLDLFSGTGAIAFEAASRGAARVVAVENQRDVASAIEEAAKNLGVHEHAAKRILPDIPGYRSEREEVYGDVALAFLAPEA
jgi:16S rRNA (guanine966-N2)-methyltransferase